MMNILPFVKLGASMVTSFGTGTIVGNAVKFTTPGNLNRVNKILIAVGSIALSGVAGDAVGKYVSEDIIQANVDSWKLGKKAGNHAADLVQAGVPVKDAFEETLNEVVDEVKKNQAENKPDADSE